MNPCRIWNNYRYYLFYLKKHICFKGACLCLDVCITLSICALFGHRMNANIELIIDLEEVLTDFLHSAITSRLGHIECRSRNAFSASGDSEWEKAAPSISLHPSLPTHAPTAKAIAEDDDAKWRTKANVNRTSYAAAITRQIRIFLKLSQSQIYICDNF